jgi:hypothetical protein
MLATTPSSTKSASTIGVVGCFYFLNLCINGTGKEHRRIVAHQVGCQFQQPIELPVRPPVFDGNVPTINIADIVQALSKCVHQMPVGLRRSAAQESDHRHPRLLRSCGKRPRDC